LNYARKRTSFDAGELRLSASGSASPRQDYSRKKAKSYPGIWNSF